MRTSVKVGIFFIFFILNGTSVLASSYIEEMQGLGYISGEGLACNAKKYPAYEFIARAYLITKASSDEEQAEGMYAYNKAKATSFIGKRNDNYLGCSEINNRFNNQKIFNSTIYSKGKIKLPDGKIIKPRRPYDANLVYDRNENERAKLNAHYDKVMERLRKKAKKEGIFQKFQQAEQNASYR